MNFDFSIVEASRAAARRERAQYIYCLFVRAKLWLTGLLDRGAVSTGPCCEPA